MNKFRKDIKEGPILLIRHVLPEDCEDIWKWRNDPEVRKFAFFQSEIPWDQHRTWFNKKLKDQDTVIFLFENNQGAKVGGVRFEIMAQNTAFISVNLNPQYIGRGLGDYVISQATKIFFKERPAAVSVLAEVLDVNIRSLKVFQKAGYLLQGKSTKQGKEIFTLKYFSHDTANFPDRGA